MADLGLLPCNLTRTHTHAFQPQFHFFAVTSVTPPPHKPLIYSQTTHRFHQNNTSFSIKQHVVFNKTTRHFSVELKSNTQEETTES